MRGLCLGVTLVIALACVFYVTGCAETYEEVLPECNDGDSRCENNSWHTCVDGQWNVEGCGDKLCIEGLGCRVCEPETKYCVGQEVRQCNTEGTEERVLETCREDQQCVLGTCLDYCDAIPSKDRSNVGCEFWAVDLPNEYYCMSMDQGKTCVTYGCAACLQFSVAIANASGFQVLVKVEQNDAKPGEPPKLSTVIKKYVGPKTLDIIHLPMREVDCTEWYKDSTNKMRRKNASETCLSSRAYRVTTSYPVVAYQFNPIINDFSNGASLLIPKNGLDVSYYVMGWSTANPISMPMPGQVIEGIPDFMNLTIVGVEENTQVEVTLAHQTQASKDNKIPAAKKGETIKLALGPFDVANINTFQDFANPTGDLTGSLVKANKPVVVFSGGARSLVPDSLQSYNPKPPEPGGEYDVCCTEHFEQQMFPVSSLGKNFAVSRTPIRSTAIPEPDFYRILATKDNTTVTTNLSDFPSFTLNEGDVAKFWSTKGFTVEADQPIMVAQFAVCQGFLASGSTGDPEFVVFPPVEQYRKEYIFLTPETFTSDHVVIAAPGDATIELDGKEVSGEFKTLCTSYTLGQVNGKDHVSYHCPVEDGIHKLTSTQPVGIMVYGYYNVGSYGYPGGADVKQINIE